MKSLVINPASGRPLDFAAIDRPFVTPALLAQFCAPSYCSHTPHSSAFDLADRLINERETSTWLRSAVVSALRRDCVDAVADCEILLSILSARLEEIQGGAK